LSKNVGDRLKELREGKKLSQAEMGRIVGKAQKTISNYEKQERELDYDTLSHTGLIFQADFVSIVHFISKKIKPSLSNR
jgi:transcriptional regulator with XRE-family HTH domain